MTFRDWMRDVDDLCMAEYSMSIHDLPDLPFFDSYQDGLNPEDFMAEYLADLEALGNLILN